MGNSGFVSLDRHGAPCLVSVVPIHAPLQGSFICLPVFKFRRQKSLITSAL